MGQAQKILEHLDAEEAALRRRKNAESEAALAENLLHMREAEVKSIGLEAVEERDAITRIRQQRAHAEQEANRVLLQMDQRKRALEKIVAETDEYIAKVEAKAVAALSGLDGKISEVARTLADIEDNTTKAIENTKVAVDKLVSIASGIIQSANKLLKKTETIHANAEKTIAHLEAAAADLNKKVLEQSKFEKTLKAREQIVELKDQEASKKLKQAEELAYWHKQPDAKYKGK